MTRKRRLSEGDIANLNGRPEWKRPPRHRTAQSKRQAVRPPARENDECRTFIEWTKLVSFDGEPLFERVVHVPNERGKAGPAVAILVSIGLRKGFPDYAILAPCGARHGLMIEAKRVGAMPNVHQVDWQAKLRRWGFDAYVCSGSAQMIDAVKLYFRETGGVLGGRFIDRTRVS